MLLTIGEKYRYSRKREPSQGFVDGLPNFFHRTSPPDHSGLPEVQLEAGINRIKPIAALDGLRTPAVLIRSSPHKAGSLTTPWHDIFDSDRGHIRYFGDNKPGRGTEALDARGNRVLAQIFPRHSSFNADERAEAVPILFFRGVPHNGRSKGQVEFHGLGLVDRIELVTQVDPRSGAHFTNLLFDFVVLDLAEEDNDLDWTWINLRRSSAASMSECLQAAPSSWRRWVAQGREALPRLRRSLAHTRVVPEPDQLPEPGSPQLRILDGIITHYVGRRGAFQPVAKAVAQRVLESSDARMRGDWATPSFEEDGGGFVARLDLGSGFSTLTLGVLGEATCAASGDPISATEIASIVARLKPGWVGVYVTTSFFSMAAQQEVREAGHPIVLIAGKRVAQEVRAMMVERNSSSLPSLLKSFDLT